jgi:hypothetical protein
VDVGDVVEGLDHRAARQVSLHQLAGRGRLVVQLGDLPVSLRVVVARVDDDRAAEWLRRDLVDRGERDRDHDEIAGRGCLRGRPGARVRTELVGETL